MIALALILGSVFLFQPHTYGLIYIWTIMLRWIYPTKVRT